MNITHKLIDGSNNDLLLYIFTNGESELQGFSDVAASVVHCHIDAEGHDITEDELFEEKNVNRIVAMFMDIFKEYQVQFPEAKRVVVGQAENAEVTLDLLLKENELFEGGILIKPLLNIALTEGIMIDDHTKVLIIQGGKEQDARYIDETEVADILSVNGYEVTSVEIEEGHDLSTTDVNVSINWLKENF